MLLAVIKLSITDSLQHNAHTMCKWLLVII